MKRQKLIDFRGTRTQSEMAKIYGITQQAWSAWENGETAPPAKVMKRLEDDIGVSMEEIFFDVFNNQKLLNGITI
ncbi:MAG: helix-turn-helix transcriptional regulator [Selenomonadaceae bacterium]|nr:helix-turn-helix transcriptional regulator [Selenomonadaceae bacterium]MBR1728897.1 helix-turn-helix transcriptional regulator [Selenomonadaceae bacterium]